jgi:heme A synthase
VPIALGVLHQAGAVALLTVAVLLLHALRPSPVAAALGSPALAASA